jgi:hypothetical protein
MKRQLLILTGLGVIVTAAFALSGTASTRAVAKAPTHAKIVIRHQIGGCHTWSLNGGSFHAKLSTALARGGTITFIDNDIMSHKLIRKSGPALRYKGSAAMRHMSASVRVTFSKAGVYRLTTKAGEDYPGMAMKTTGEDNVLRLTVKVS